jgi:hypothetical protein
VIISTEQAIADLGGTTCRGCGGTKRSRMSHCRKCFLKLPQVLRSALYRRVGRGYEEAYTESLAVLRTPDTAEGAR